MLKKLLVANRGEIAVRIVRAADDLGVPTVAVHSEDDSTGLHVRLATHAVPLGGSGPASYLDARKLVDLALQHGCDAVHPGYGLLSESAEFAQYCDEAGLIFVGPRSEVLKQFGDKSAGRTVALECGVAVVPGTLGPTSLEQAREFMSSLGAGASVMLKAVGGGGGRGMRAVREAAELESAWQRCASEATALYGSGDLFVEQFVDNARHVEVQIVGDGLGGIVDLGERECTLQRRHQKVLEVAPSPSLGTDLRNSLLDNARHMATHVNYEGVGTFEFLIDGDGQKAYFIEANPRIQVEHTVTEAVHGVDLVQAQLLIAAGATVADLGLARRSEPEGCAVQARVCAEVFQSDGTVLPATGAITRFTPPSGPSVRVDTHAYQGYSVNIRFDSLIAKVIVHARAGAYRDALRMMSRALMEFDLAGVDTNLGFLTALVSDERVLSNDVSTQFIEENARRLALEAREAAANGAGILASDRASNDHNDLQGMVDEDDPNAVAAPMTGTVVEVVVSEGDEVRTGQPVAVLEAMKMEHLVAAPTTGVVDSIGVTVGDTVSVRQPLMSIIEADLALIHEPEAEGASAGMRPDLVDVLERHIRVHDDARPSAVEARHSRGHRTARENVDALCDAGTFVEFGTLVVAAQRRRRSFEDLAANTPADGLIAGTGVVNGDPDDSTSRRCVVMATDYTVLAGTIGVNGFRKIDRMIHVASRAQLPVVLFTEGGGGRAGDVDWDRVAGFDGRTFADFAGLSGKVPLIGINSGRCFAGNAALLSCCDVIIATADSNIGMGGPAMVEGGGLGVVAPEEIGPMDVQVPNGVVDILVKDETEAVAAAKHYLSFVQGPVSDWRCEEQDSLRDLIPQNRRRTYDVRGIINTLADVGSVLELRPQFGRGIITAFARVEGRPLGIVANNPSHLAGAIDSKGADKASKFLQLCERNRLPVLFLCDTPGVAVGPEAEKHGTVREAGGMFVTAAKLSVPFGTIVLRRCYGLGAVLMMGGSEAAPDFVVSWPTGEFGSMGLEGEVRLGFRRELESIPNETERKGRESELVAQAYRRGGAVNVASNFEVDDVIDPSDSRRWVRLLHRDAG